MPATSILSILYCPRTIFYCLRLNFKGILRALFCAALLDYLLEGRYAHRMPHADTTTQLLDVAQSMMQARGYNAFSYKDIAESVGIRTASIHYHFPSKADLGVGVMQRYIEELEIKLDEIGCSKSTNTERLEAFSKLYITTESCDTICLCGSLASDHKTLPEALQFSVAAYLKATERWVAEVVAAGIKSGEFSYTGRPLDFAKAYVSSLQGGLIVSRAGGNKSRVVPVVQRVFLQMLNAD